VRKILIIEDNPDHLALINNSLQRSRISFKIDICTSIFEARQYLDKNSPELIVSDCRLPDGHGESFLDSPKIKEKIPIVFMSSQGNEQLAVSLIKKGALDYLVKDNALFKDLPKIINRAIREWENITARKEAEERLYYTENKYKLVTDNINDVIWELNVDFERYLFISQSVKEFLGYTEKEFVSIPFGRTITKESRQKVKDLKHKYREHLRLGNTPRNFSIQLELEFLHKDGSTRWGEIRGFLVTNHLNQVTSINGVTRNISLQKAAEKQLKIQEAYFETLIQEAPLAIVILNKDDTIKQVNKEFTRLFEFPEEECIGRYINDLIVPGSLKPEGLELTGEVSRGNFINIDTLRQTRSGKLLNVSIQGKPVIFDDHLIAVFGIYRDITQQKKTEEHLQKISERLILATSAASIGIWDFDLKSRDVVWDHEMYKLHEIDQNSTGDLMKLWESSVIEEDKALLDFIFSQKEFYRKGFENVYRLNTQSGEIKHIRLFARVHFEEGEGATRVIGCCLDITSQMENAELSKQVEVSARVASIKQQFLANMSHEIRSPVTGILGMADLLMKSTLTQRQKFYAETIKASSDSLLQIVNDILDLSKIEAGKMVIKPDWFNLRESGQRVFNLFHALAEQKNLRFSFVFDSRLPQMVYGDEHRISQVITNLVSNAIKFTEKGWVKIHFHCADDQPEFVKIETNVEDSGIGINEDDMNKLFNLFSQVDTSDTRNYDGTGLGLAISERLAELMHAKIKVRSTPGEGSNFSLVFVSPKAGEELINPLSGKIRFNGTNKEKPAFSILLVEDKKTNQMVVSMMLEEFGHKVEIASNGQLALDMVAPGKYDFILMDIQMPVMDGLTAVRKLRTKYREDELPVIIGLSAKAMEGDPEYYVARGMNDYLTKPVDSDTLQNCLLKYRNKKHELSNQPL
jgi:PAS domain S-box-containing protein